MSSSISLTNPARAALRRAIADAAQAAGLPAIELATLRRQLQVASKDELLAAAQRFSIDINAVIAKAASMPSAQQAFAAPPSQTAGQAFNGTPPAPAPAIAQAAADPVQAELDAIDAAWRDMDVQRHRDLITDLARRAHRPDTVVEVVVRSMSQRPQAKRVATSPAGTVFGITGPLASLELPVYDAPDAPKRDPHYVLPPDMPTIVGQLFKRQRAVWLAGPAGTGKTTLCEEIAARLGRPFVRISCTATTEPETLKGMTVPDADGGHTWQDGQLTAAIKRRGAVILIDEPSVCRDGTLYVFQSVLDTARMLCLDEAAGEVVRVAEDVVFLLADNTAGQGDMSGQYNGTRMVSEAIRNRVGATIEMDYLPAAKEAKLLAQKAGAPPALTTILVNYAAMTRQKANNGELPAAIGFRRLLSWAEMIVDGAHPHHAAAYSFITAASPEAQEVLRQLLVTHAPLDAIRAALS